MYSHIKIGNLVEITGINYAEGKNNNVHLVVEKEYDHKCSSKCIFYLLNEEGKLLRYYANANNPYKNIKNLL